MADESPKAENPYEYLKTEIDGYIQYSRRWARVWAVVYYLLRTALIVVSACVAAKADLRLDAYYAAILSLLVAVGTALDTWLKTGNRYKGHFTFNDKFIALHTWIRRENAVSGLKGLQSGGPGEYRFCEAFYHR